MKKCITCDMPSAVDAARAAQLADALAGATRSVIRETAWALVRRADVVREGLDGRPAAALAELGSDPLSTPLAQACREYTQCAEALRTELGAANAVLERALGQEPDDPSLDPVAVSMAIPPPVVPLLGEQLPINQIYPVEGMPIGWEQPLDVLLLPALDQVVPQPAQEPGTSTETAIAVDNDDEQKDAPAPDPGKNNAPIDLTSIDLDPLGGTDFSWLGLDNNNGSLDLNMFDFDQAT